MPIVRSPPSDPGSDDDGGVDDGCDDEADADESCDRCRRVVCWILGFAQERD